VAVTVTVITIEFNIHDKEQKKNDFFDKRILQLAQNLK
jgi:hypothetical protein